MSLEDNAEGTTRCHQKVETLLLGRCDFGLVLLEVLVQLGLGCHNVVDSQVCLVVAFFGQPVESIYAFCVHAK